MPAVETIAVPSAAQTCVESGRENNGVGTVGMSAVVVFQCCTKQNSTYRVGNTDINGMQCHSQSRKTAGVIE
jgi:hypothetical protein